MHALGDAVMVLVTRACVHFTLGNLKKVFPKFPREANPVRVSEI